MSNKKTFTFLLLLAILMLFFGFIVGSAYEQEKKKKENGQYPKTMIVYELDEKNDIITLIDFNGFTYQIKGIEDIFKGDILSCIMDDAGTDTITDDAIIDYRYSGWLEGWNK